MGGIEVISNNNRIFFRHLMVRQPAKLQGTFIFYSDKVLCSSEHLDEGLDTYLELGARSWGELNCSVKRHWSFREQMV